MICGKTFILSLLNFSDREMKNAIGLYYMVFLKYDNYGML